MLYLKSNYYTILYTTSYSTISNFHAISHFNYHTTSHYNYHTTFILTIVLYLTLTIMLYLSCLLYPFLLLYYIRSFYCATFMLFGKKKNKELFKFVILIKWHKKKL